MNHVSPKFNNTKVSSFMATQIMLHADLLKLPEIHAYRVASYNYNQDFTQPAKYPLNS